MSEVSDSEFIRVMTGNGFGPMDFGNLPEAQPHLLDVELGERYRQFLLGAVNEVVGIPEICMSGELSLEKETEDAVVEHLLRKSISPEAPIQLGARIAITGLGFVLTQKSMNQPFFDPELLAQGETWFGTLMAPVLSDYVVVDEAAKAMPGTAAWESTYGLTVFLKDVHVYNNRTGLSLLEPHDRLSAPVGVDDLQFHAVQLAA